MAFVPTPRTEVGDRTRLDLSIPDYSEMPSFQAPAGKDDLLKAVRNPRNAFATPSARAPLANRNRNVQTKNEFTPLLHSAAKNRLLMRDRGSKENGGLATPAALKPGFQLSPSNLPDASSIMDSSMVSEHTPVADVNSSSFDNSTPMALPKGQLDGGNVLTLREQEAKLEKIDKENFGLKLKIHFLEENLKKTGTEWSQQTIRENTELKVTKMTMEQELKRYRKSLVQAEKDLEAYKQQLHDYADKVQRRHMDEAMKEELDRLRQLADDRENQLAQMQLRLESAENTAQSIGKAEKLQEELDQLEAEVQAKDRELDEKDDEIDTLKEKLRVAENEDEADEEKDRQLQEQADRIEELEAELRNQSRHKEEELEAVQEQLEAAHRDHAAELEELRRDAENAQKEKRDQLREFESRLQAYNREKNEEIENLHRKLQAAEKDKADEIESLELRVKLAESKGDNQSQLAHQAAEDARNQVKVVTAEKDGELDDLRAQLSSMHGIQDELDSCQRQLQDYAADTEERHREERLREEVLTKLRDAVADKDREIKSLKNTSTEHDTSVRELERTREIVAERERGISALQKTIEAQAISLQDLRKTRTELASRDEQLVAAIEESKQLRSTISERERQLETVRKTLDDRNAELEVLRQANEEPDTQIEGMQSIIRQRDNNLEDLRKTVEELEAKLESLKMTADERLRTIDELGEQLIKTKQELEDEIHVLEATLDEAEEDRDNMESKVRILESQLEDTKEMQGKLSPLGKDLRVAQREKSRLEKQIESLERDRDIADEERISLQSTIEELRKDLQNARSQPKFTPSKDREVSSLRQQLEDLRFQLEEKEAAIRIATDAAENRAQQSESRAVQRHGKEMKELHDLLRNSTLEVESLQARLNHAEKELASLPALRASLRAKEGEIEDLQVDSTRQLHTRAQEGREETGKLRADIMSLEKKHYGELKGLAKQITFLRGRVERERCFREALGFQKRWFLMNVEMYSECNQADLRLLEDMGVTPDRSIRERRPTLKTVGLLVVFLARAKRLAGQWSEKKKVQEQLVMKLDAMRSRKQQATSTHHHGRKSLPLGTR